MGYLLVGIGGVFGSLARFALGKYISEHSKTSFPRGTFIINIVGAMLLGIVAVFQSDKNLYLLFGDGFLGAFTTFSTFTYESLKLLEQKEKLNAMKYIFGSLILGILGFVLGAKIGNVIKLM